MADIDERLEALTARHEAIAQSVELLTHDVRELQGTVKVLVEHGEKTDKRINNLLSITLKIGADFARRIEDLEKKDGEQ